MSNKGFWRVICISARAFAFFTKEFDTLSVCRDGEEDRCEKFQFLIKINYEYEFVFIENRTISF